MEPTKFNGQNVVYAENQPEYIPLPAHKDAEGTVTTCWRFSVKDRIRVLFGARLYWKQMTFNAPLQPVMPSIGDRRRNGH